MFYSCNKNNNETGDSKVREYSETDNLPFYNMDYKYYEQASNNKFCIVRVTLWRKSNNCLHGLGICKVEFFCTDKAFNENSSREIEIPLVVEQEDNLSLNVYFSQDVSMYSAEELKLVIDEDVVAEDIDNLFSNDIFLERGEVPFDAALGDFGGYHILL